MPTVLKSAILLGIAAILQYLLDNVGLFNIPPLYAPLVTMGVAVVLKMIQEALPKKPAPIAQARGACAPEHPAGYWQRVVVG